MNEHRLNALILKYFEKGSWDYHHTLAAVYWMKKLIEREGGDKKVLITAIYFHDIGYSLKTGHNLSERIAMKKKHLLIGAKEAERILAKEDYTPDEIKKISHLIMIHDDLPSIKTKDEILVFEADSLSQIDYSRVNQTFNKEDFERFLGYFQRERIPRFKTKTGKFYLQKLLKELNKRLTHKLYIPNSS